MVARCIGVVVGLGLQQSFAVMLAVYQNEVRRFFPGFLEAKSHLQSKLALGYDEP